MNVTGALFVIHLATVQDIVYSKRTRTSGCNLQTNDFVNKHPFILKQIAEPQKYEFDDPDNENLISFASNQIVLFSCPKSGFEDTKNVLISATCVGKNQFLVKSDGTAAKKQTFDNLQCKSVPGSVLKENGKCSDNKNAYVVGFDMDNNTFLKIMDICFDTSIKSPVYVNHTITPSIKWAEQNTDRPSFKEDKLFDNISASDMYTKNHQTDVFAKIVSKNSVNTYINNTCYLVKGHLSPMADFVWSAQQTATFYFANAMPQWQPFNNGNWVKLEASIRNLAADTNVTLAIYTGTYGVFGVNGTPVYLANNAIPVPMVYWKIVYDKKNGRATAFVGLNDLWADVNNNPAKTMCSPDVCSQIKWVTFKSELKFGLMYCCKVSDLAKTVKTFPDIGKVSLLDH